MPGHRPDKESNKKEFDRIRAELNRRLLMLYRGITLEAHKRIVLRTPVKTGRARGNWNIDAKPNEDVTDVTDKSGSKAIAKARQYTRELTLEDKTWIVNNLPYISVLENGGYPNPSKHGTKTIGGYSKQAPHGMVAVTVAEIEEMLPALIAQVRDSGK